ncbi:endonuclease MutS2 [Haliangium sp.]|uniref:endonuclease MutS2 n=1 Tax=Haliangium sp. TaxID=2663208 RepID=UPI003D113FF8
MSPSASATISPKTLTDLGWDRLVDHLVRRTHTARGASAAAEIGFFDDPDAARERMDEIDEARRLAELEAAMPFGGIRDVVTAVSRAAKGGVLEPSELIDVATTARGLTRLRKHLDQHQQDAPLLCDRAAVIADFKHLYEPIERSFDPDGRLADHASDALGPLRREAAQLERQVEQRIRAFVDDRRNEHHLQDRYFTSRDGRYVVPVRLEARGQVRGIVHGTSQSGRTLFVEPDAVVEIHNRWRVAQCEVEEEERRILAMLSDLVGRDQRGLVLAVDVATALDLIDAGARLATVLGASKPTLSAQRRLSLLSARHPLMVLSERPCVANDIALEPGRILILSGPNAGGKTVALKTTGLCALMVRCGLHLPVEPGSEMPWFRGVRCDIGDAQSLENDLSTFSAHLVELKEYLAAADDQGLLLVDEIAVGTEPEQGAALAQAVLEALAARGTMAIITTHYERLKALGASDERFANASVGFDLERMEPTFRLHLGVPGSSGALAVARRMGLPEPVLAQAEELMGERRASVEELLASLADERRKLVEERAALAQARTRAERAQADADAARDAAKARERALIEGAHSDALAALRQARSELEQVRADIKRQGKRARARRSPAQPSQQPTQQVDFGPVNARISALAQAVADQAPARERPAGTRPAPAPDALAAGTRVYVTSLGSRGEVVEPPQRGRVVVQVGPMRTTVAVADLLLDDHAARTAQAQAQANKPSGSTGRGKRSRGSAAPAVEPDEAPVDDVVLRTNDITVDVRGERAEEAVSSVDRFIDQCLMSARDVVFVIHGHGTGALRSAIREHLAGHHAVSRWRPGDRREGGDGVTIAWLDVA